MSQRKLTHSTGRKILKLLWGRNFDDFSDSGTDQVISLKEQRGYELRALAAVMTVVIFMLTSGCSSHTTVKHEVTDLPADIPLSFSSSGVTTSPDLWWKNFNDEKLTFLINTALEDNLTIKSSWARIDQAMALRTRSRSAQRITANASLTGATSDLTSDKSIESYTLSVPAAYEVDLYNRLQNLTDATSADVLSSRYAMEATAQNLAASVAETWFRLLRTVKSLELSQKQLELNQTYLELIELRFAQGQATALDVYQQRQQLANTRLLVPDIISENELLQNQLALLTGKAPGTVSLPVPDNLPSLPPLPKTGIPVDLLEKRPDVQQAFARLVAADHRLAAAVEQKKPSLRITTEPGFTSSTPSDVFSSFIVRLGASLLAPVLDGGRIKADIFRQRAVVEEALNHYGQTMITAISEVEDALIKEKYQKQRINQIKENIELTNKTLREAKLRYMNGLSDYLPAITALTSLQALERLLVTSVQQLLSHRLSLYRALGGYWMKGLKRPWQASSPKNSYKTADGNSSDRTNISNKIAKTENNRNAAQTAEKTVQTKTTGTSDSTDNSAKQSKSQ